VSPPGQVRTEGGIEHVKLRSLVLIAVAATVVLVVPAAHSGIKTTEPEVFEMIDVTLTDTKIVLSDKSADRGEGVDFKIRNAGKKPHSFALLAASPVIISLDRQGLSTPLLKPGKTSVLSVFMDARGTFVYRSLARADRSKPLMHGKFTVN
jgi:hypothetical protein